MGVEVTLLSACPGVEDRRISTNGQISMTIKRIGFEKTGDERKELSIP